MNETEKLEHIISCIKDLNQRSPRLSNEAGKMLMFGKFTAIAKHRNISVKSKKFIPMINNLLIEKGRLVYDTETGFITISIDTDSKGYELTTIDEIKSKCGIIYVQRYPDGTAQVFMSHLIDRYAQRTNACSMFDRKKALRKFFQGFTLFNQNNSVGLNVDAANNTTNIITNHTDGILIGFRFKDFYIWKTFISKDMQDDKQEQHFDRIKSYNVAYTETYNLLTKHNKFNDELQRLEQLKEEYPEIYSVCVDDINRRKQPITY